MLLLYSSRPFLLFTTVPLTKKHNLPSRLTARILFYFYFYKRQSDREDDFEEKKLDDFKLDGLKLNFFGVDAFSGRLFWSLFLVAFLMIKQSLGSSSARNWMSEESRFSKSHPGSAERRNFSTRSLPTITSSRATPVESVGFDAKNNYELQSSLS